MNPVTTGPGLARTACLGAIVVALLMPGCIGEVKPIVSISNWTDEEHEIHVTIRTISGGQPHTVVFERTVVLGPQDDREIQVDLRGVHNVTAKSGGQRGSADMEFWSGGFLGGQMYADIRIDETGLVVSEAHAD